MANAYKPIAQSFTNIACLAFLIYIPYEKYLKRLHFFTNELINLIKVYHLTLKKTMLPKKYFLEFWQPLSCIIIFIMLSLFFRTGSTRH